MVQPNTDTLYITSAHQRSRSRPLVDAGAAPLALGFSQPERLPPQNDEISGSSSYSQSYGSSGTSTGSGSTKGRTLLLR
ncbi:hypothetical protein B0H19DRAFT_1272631 [Mycena capillaripes]|nr:hypothetical protein B0H19DRAFT_1272631 [Mycena capillaripes]